MGKPQGTNMHSSASLKDNVVERRLWNGSRPAGSSRCFISTKNWKKDGLIIVGGEGNYISNNGVIK
jgi:hypothetical protein